MIQMCLFILGHEIYFTIVTVFVMLLKIATYLKFPWNLNFSSRRRHRLTWPPLRTTTSESQLRYRTTIAQNQQKSSLTAMELKKPHPSGLVGGTKMWNGLVPHLQEVDKNPGGISWEQGVPAPHQSPQPRVAAPGTQLPTTSGCKNKWDLSQWEKLLEPQAVPLNGPTHGLTYSDSLPLSCSNGVAAWGAPEASWERLRCLASRRAEAIVPFLGFSPTEPADWCPNLRLHKPG